ncbi:hypothetical protein K1T73_09860 [Roseovarius sp. SCSIO 43702]|uniref:hypothetical protein n=1 Tax=Roseovarius sp. SCSIO 43702 TaxID=2823043 RepID=UPI001C7377F6|nr:hypothetical protein [Roseovarius sp. SCSIO 43702]QYX55418.1 hypothetical protein K1T73_09860 [Roseovarius sp. SCSIO 43702]
MSTPKKDQSHNADEKASDDTVAKPDNAINPDDAFGKPEEGEEWTHSAMNEALRKPAYKTGKGKTAKKQVDDLKDD